MTPFMLEESFTCRSNNLLSNHFRSSRHHPNQSYQWMCQYIADLQKQHVVSQDKEHIYSLNHCESWPIYMKYANRRLKIVFHAGRGSTGRVKIRFSSVLSSSKFIYWSIFSNEILSELFVVATFILFAISSSVNGADVEPAGPLTNGSGKW